MFRAASIACLLGALLVAACSKSPTSPGVGGAAASVPGPDAKPGGGSPTPTAHLLTFGPSIGPPPNGYDGYPSPGHLSGSNTVSGWITGPNAAGYFKASAAGGFTMTISDVDKLPDDAAGGDPCTEPEQDSLRAIGLVAAPVAGVLTLTIDEDAQGSVTGPTLAWELGNIQVASQPGYTWKITGASGSTNPLFRPVFDPASTNSSLTVTLENGRAHFSRFPNGGRKPSADQFIACRTDFTLVMSQ